MAIPMVSRLLTEMGGNLRLFDQAEVAPAQRLAMTGVFHVKDAGTAFDSEDRPIIPAKTFVSEERIKSVFAVGATWAEGTFLTAILFTREVLERPQAARFVSVLEWLKTTAATNVDVGRIFRAAAGPSSRVQSGFHE